MKYWWKCYFHHSFFGGPLLVWSVALLSLLLYAVLKVFLDENLVEFLLAVLAHHHLHLLVWQHDVIDVLGFLLFALLLLILLHRLDGRSEVLRSRLPVLSSFGLVETLTPGHPHLLLLVHLGLLHYLCLRISLSYLLLAHPLGLRIKLFPLGHEHQFASLRMFLQSLPVEFSTTTFRAHHQIIFTLGRKRLLMFLLVDGSLGLLTNKLPWILPLYFLGRRWFLPLRLLSGRRFLSPRFFLGLLFGD